MGGRVAHEQHTYICIDLKTFYASVECVDRGLDPLTTNLVVADESRGRTTICLAITQAMKDLGIHNRCRLFEIPDGIDYITAVPRMQHYMEVSAKIYGIYLEYVSPQDVHVYSIDECFIDVTPYLDLYHTDAEGFACTLRDEVLNRGIPVVDFTSAIELIKDENGHCAGAILLNMETKELLIARAKTVILATGGAGRLHYQGFPTSNHYGATADGLVLGYRAGAKLLYPDTLQYHPTGAAYPAQIYGALVTEKVRSVGAMLVNADGEVFMNPLETRDVAAASIIRECTERGKGVKTPAGQAVWLDTPMIELKNGAGTIEKRIPAMMRMFAKHGIDIRKEPILVYPTLHYQNGGLHITPDGQTDVENLFAAGEVAGGSHGRNRLMGNSLLDVIVFGRNAGQHAAEKAKSVSVGTLTLDHVAAFEAEKQQAGVTDHRLSPQLLPDYARKIHPAEK